MPDSARTLWVWRHPRPAGVAGLCLGQADLPVDARKAKRLAHQIRRTARRAGLPREVTTSPLKRAADVGRWLRRWGWRHVMEARIQEMSFGAWDGRPWQKIPQAEVDAWCADFWLHRPGGGENLQALFERAAGWRPPVAGAAGLAAIVVSHGGWMIARRWLTRGSAMPTRADQWPAPPRHGGCWQLPAEVASAHPPP